LSFLFFLRLYVFGEPGGKRDKQTGRPMDANSRGAMGDHGRDRGKRRGTMGGTGGERERERERENL
jgi:hypothetical protein